MLHPLKSELNFPVGAKNVLDLDPHRWRLPMHILDGLFHTQALLNGEQPPRLSPKAHGIVQRLAEVASEGFASEAITI